MHCVQWLCARGPSWCIGSFTSKNVGGCFFGGKGRNAQLYIANKWIICPRLISANTCNLSDPHNKRSVWDKAVNHVMRE